MKKKELLKLLKFLYGKENCYLIDIIKINSKKKEVKCSFLIPKDSEYTEVPVPYVTAENYIRCISQLLITAINLLFRKQADYSYKNAGKLKKSFAGLQWFYKEFNSLQFKKLVPKGEVFLITAVIKRIKQYKKNRFFVECEVISEAVIGTVKLCQLTEGHPYLPKNKNKGGVR